MRAMNFGGKSACRKTLFLAEDFLFIGKVDGLLYSRVERLKGNVLNMAALPYHAFKNGKFEENMNKVLGIAIYIYATFVYGSPEIKGSPDELKSFFHPDQKTILITDTAEERAYTDHALVNLVVTTEDKLLSTAMSLNQNLRQKIKKTLLENGIPENDIKNSKFSSSPQYGWFGSDPDSYEVMNRVAIKIATEKQLQAIALVSDNHDEITFAGTSFEHSKKIAFQKMVKEKALNKILEKKKFYEASLGIKLFPIAFSESDVGFAATHGAHLLDEEIIVTGSRASKTSLSKQRNYAPQRDNSFDEIEYRATVSVEFRIE